MALLHRPIPAPPFRRGLLFGLVIEALAGGMILAACAVL